jgi:hypothetical protein
VEAGGKESSRLVGVSGYRGKRREMEDRISVPLAENETANIHRLLLN